MTIEKVEAVLRREAEAILNIPATDSFDNAIHLIHRQVHEKGGKLVSSGMGKAGEIARNISTILELVELAGRLYQNLPLIVITANAESGLAKTADVCLLTGDPGEVCPLGLSPTTSTTVMTVIGDALIVLMMDKIEFTNEEYAKRHHGGYLGSKSRDRTKNKE